MSRAGWNQILPNFDKDQFRSMNGGGLNLLLHGHCSQYMLAQTYSATEIKRDLQGTPPSMGSIPLVTRKGKLDSEVGWEAAAPRGSHTSYYFIQSDSCLVHNLPASNEA